VVEAEAEGVPRLLSAGTTRPRPGLPRHSRQEAGAEGEEVEALALRMAMAATVAAAALAGLPRRPVAAGPWCLRSAAAVAAAVAAGATDQAEASSALVALLERTEKRQRAGARTHSPEPMARKAACPKTGSPLQEEAVG